MCRISARSRTGVMIRPRRFLKDKRGASAIEFALVVPIMLIILLGTIDFGMVLFAKNVTQEAARAVVRDLSTNKITSAEASSASKAMLPEWVSRAVTVDIEQTFPGDSARNEFRVSINFNGAAVTAVGFFDELFSGSNLSSYATMRQEPTL